MSDRFHLAVRFLRARVLSLDDYVRQGIMTADDQHRIRRFLEWKRMIVVSGATGSGKTTLLNAMLNEVATGLVTPDGVTLPPERILIVEDTPELRVTGPDVVYLQTTPGEDLSRLVQTTLRLRPDRIILGEVRGSEALEVMRAANTGHAGTLVTLHSNGSAEALGRLYTLAVEGQPTYPFEAVVAACDWVLQLVNTRGERKLAEIWKVPHDDSWGARRGGSSGGPLAAAAAGATRR